MKELLLHLINDHGYKNIAFISSPLTKYNDFRERYDIYRETLKECGIPFNQDLVTLDALGLTNKDGKKAVKILLDKRKAPINAIVAVSDEMAIGAIEELKERGITAGKDIAVTGFDDVGLFGYYKETLTTVKNPVYNIGF